MVRKIAGPAAMRAVAHPLRLQILTEMWDADRPLRSADLAQVLGEPANSVSYHVRQLRDAGFLVDAQGPQGRTARDHWYRVPEKGDPLPDQDSETGTEAFSAVLRSRYSQLADDLISARSRESGTLVHVDGTIWLTEKLAAQYVERFAVLARQMRDASDEALETAEDGTPFSRYTFVTDIVPQTRRGAVLSLPVEEVPGMEETQEPAQEVTGPAGPAPA